MNGNNWGPCSTKAKLDLYSKSHTTHLPGCMLTSSQTRAFMQVQRASEVLSHMDEMFPWPKEYELERQYNKNDLRD